jgi:uncharacterized protein
MTDKPSQNEEEYFAKLDAELINRKRLEQQREAMAAERRSHFMKCPKCGASLETVDYHEVHIDRCPECGGVWLDDGELGAITRHADPGFVGRVFRDFLGKGKGRK